MPKVLVHGHRGARARMPENTLAGFQYAIHCGADAIELDLVLTADGRVVVSHDPVLEAGPEPALRDVFRLAALGAFSYDLEIKWGRLAEPDGFVEIVLDEIRASHLEARVAVLSFDCRALRAMRRLAPMIRLAALTESDVLDFAEIARAAAHAEIVAPQFHLLTAAKVAAAHAAAIEIVPWTVNSPADWGAMIAARVDGIITDDPAGLIAHLEERGLR